MDLMKAISLVKRYGQGEVAVRREAVARALAKLRGKDIGMVFQNYHLLTAVQKKCLTFSKKFDMMFTNIKGNEGAQ